MTEGIDEQEYFLEAFYAQTIVEEHRNSVTVTISQYRYIADAMEYMLDKFGAVPPVYDYRWVDILTSPIVTFYIADPPKKWIHYVPTSFGEVTIYGTFSEELYENLSEEQKVEIGRGKESLWNFLQIR